MKGIWFRTLLVLFFAVFTAGILWLSQGCNYKIPPLAAAVATPQPNNVISNFTNGSLVMNPSLKGFDNGYFQQITYGGAPGLTNMINGSLTPKILETNPGDGSAYAVHLSGAQYDYCATGAGSSTYPAFFLYAFLSNNPVKHYKYDLTPFQGVSFNINVLPDDGVILGTSTQDPNYQRMFAIGVAQQTPPTNDPGGICPPPFGGGGGNCYDYFWGNGTALPSSLVGAGWQPVTFLFSQLQTAGWGALSISSLTTPCNGNITYTTGPPLPCPGSGTFETEALFLMWKFGDNGGCGNDYTDFWVDNVSFY